jgi:hypothetical protein
MNLEAELRAIDVEWPRTPQLELVLEPSRRRDRRLLVVAIVLAVAALAAALAVPQSRAAILRIFHLGGATVKVVDTLPRADARSLTVGLGPVISLDSARRLLPGLLVPPLDTVPPLHYGSGNVVSVVFERDGHPVLLSELPGGGGVYLKKLASGGSRIEPVRVQGDEGLWISGGRHVVYFPYRSPRLAGNVLLWETGSTTYRLEGPHLTRDEAVSLAESLRRG